MVSSDLLKILTVLLSAGSIPIVAILIKQVSEDIKSRKTDRRIAYILLALFTLLLATAILSLFISGGSYAKDSGSFNDLNLMEVSRWRSFLFSLGNFLTSLSFWLITRGHYKP